jgi:uncharacterized membrane protein (DUF373 family)
MQFKSNIDKLFGHVEYLIYVTIALIMTAAATLLIYDVITTLLHFPNDQHLFTKWIVEVLDKTLLILMIIEILYTVRVSYKEHTLSAEPFLTVGLIAAIRRILVISVETAYYEEKFEHFMIEISIIGVLILIFVVSHRILTKNKEKDKLKHTE